MTAKVLKRSRAKLVSKQIVEQVGVALQELPEKTPDTLSLRQTIERLREPLEAALAKGYGYEELVPMLAQQGINIQPSTLKRYVLSGGDRANRRRGTGKGKPRQSRKKSGEVTSADAEQLIPDLAELTAATDEAPAPARKRGRAAAKASPEPAASIESEPVKQTRSRRTGGRAASTAKPRSTSTRGRKAKA